MFTDANKRRQTQASVRQERKSIKISFLGSERVEKFVPSLESLSSLVSMGGILPGRAGPLGVFKNFVQKTFLSIFRSLFRLSERGPTMQTNAHKREQTRTNRKSKIAPPPLRQSRIKPVTHKRGYDTTYIATPLTNYGWEMSPN